MPVRAAASGASTSGPRQRGVGRRRVLQARGQRRRARHALRPVAERPVRPHVHLANLADGAGGDVLVAEAGLVARVPLVAHLRHELGIVLRLLRQQRALPRPTSTAASGRRRACRGPSRRRAIARVHVIGRRDDDRVDVLLLLEHLAIVAILLNLRQLLVDEPGQVLGGVAARTLLVRGQLGRGRLAARAGARARRRRLRAVRARPRPASSTARCAHRAAP